MVPEKSHKCSRERVWSREGAWEQVKRRVQSWTIRAEWMDFLAKYKNGAIKVLSCHHTGHEQPDSYKCKVATSATKVPLGADVNFDTYDTAAKWACDRISEIDDLAKNALGGNETCVGMEGYQTDKWVEWVWGAPWPIPLLIMTILVIVVLILIR